jgi:plasmid segregation protein ParM
MRKDGLETLLYVNNLMHSPMKGFILENISIAIDGGHSSFKVRAARASSPSERISLQIPTFVTPAITIAHDQTRLLAESETVELAGQKYFFGETAFRQSRAETFTGQHIDWIETVQHDVMLLGAWQKVTNMLDQGPANIRLVMGLPAKHYAAQKELLRQRAEDLLRPRLGSGQELHVLIQSQSDAPLQWLSINADGTINAKRNIDQESWGVIEIGHFTTDFSMSIGGSVVDHAVTSCAGLGIVYEALSTAMAAERFPTDLQTVETAFRTLEIKVHGQSRHLGFMVHSALSTFTAYLLDEANRIFAGKAAVLDGIVVGGGGAEVMFSRLNSKFPTAVCSNDPRQMVAEGFCRLGLLSFS